MAKSKGKAVKSIVHQATYVTAGGKTITKTHTVVDYQTAFNCLMDLDIDKLRAKFARTLIKSAIGLTTEDKTKIREMFLPTAAETRARNLKAAANHRILHSCKFEKHCDREIDRMTAHSGFMSNSPF